MISEHLIQVCLKISWCPQYSHGNHHHFPYQNCHLNIIPTFSNTPNVESPPFTGGPCVPSPTSWGQSFGRLVQHLELRIVGPGVLHHAGHETDGFLHGHSAGHHLGLHQWGAVGEGQLPGTWGEGWGGWLGCRDTLSLGSERVRMLRDCQ